MIQTGAVIGFSTADQQWPKTTASTPRRDVMAPWQARCIQGYIAANLRANIQTADLASVVQLVPDGLSAPSKSTLVVHQIST